MVKFVNAVKAKLRSKTLDPVLTLECKHDLFRCLFRNKGYPSEVPGAIMLNMEDFVRLPLPLSWNYALNRNGDGYCVKFPIRAKSVLKKSPKDFILDDVGKLVQLPTYIFEQATFYITKNPCSKNSITM